MKREDERRGGGRGGRERRRGNKNEQTALFFVVDRSFVGRTNGLSGMLRTVYPNHTWIDEDSSRMSCVCLFLCLSSSLLLLRLLLFDVLSSLSRSHWFISLKQHISLLFPFLLFPLSSAVPNTGSNNKWEGRKTQVLLAKVVRSLLPSGTKIYSNYRHKEISLEYSARPLELDVYVPSFRLALEFQGVFHSYSDKPNFFGDPTLQWERDQKKREDCQVFWNDMTWYGSHWAYVCPILLFWSRRLWRALLFVLHSFFLLMHMLIFIFLLLPFSISLVYVAPWHYTDWGSFHLGWSCCHCRSSNPCCSSGHPPSLSPCVSPTFFFKCQRITRYSDTFLIW